MELKKSKFDYKWVILALGMLMNVVCLGFCSSNKGMYMSAITDALSIKRSVFSLNESFRFVATALVNLFFGALVHRFGIRKMVAFGFVATIGSMAMFATAETAVGFWIAGAMLGVGLAFTTTTMTGSIVRRWFKQNVGRYTGIVFAANGVGGAIAAQLISPLINEPGNPFGYRKAYYRVIAVTVVTGIITVLFLRERPADGEQLPQTTGKKRKGVFWTGIDFATARKKPYFYLASAAVLVTGMSLQGINSAYIAHMKDVGLTAEFVAAMARAFSLMLTMTKIAVGWMYDRFGLKTVMAVCPLAAAVGFSLLAFVAPNASGMVMAACFGVLYALALPLETLVVPLIVNDLFGAVSYDKMLGIFAAINYVGYAIGSPLVNLSFDIFGTYSHALLVCGGVMLGVCIAFRFVLRSVDKMKKELEVNV